MEPGPAQAEIIYFVLHKISQFPSDISVCVEYKYGD